jgi:hypothetical protein
MTWVAYYLMSCLETHTAATGAKEAILHRFPYAMQ